MAADLVEVVGMFSVGFATSCYLSDFSFKYPGKTIEQLILEAIPKYIDDNEVIRNSQRRLARFIMFDQPDNSPQITDLPGR